MKKSNLFKLSALAGAIAMVTACGDSATTSDIPASTSEKTVGVITGFGSIYINGVKFETSSIDPRIDGQLLPETELGVGDVCEITGTVNADGVSGTAQSVVCDDEVEGYIVEINLAADGTGTINVMGQTVHVTGNTVFNSDTVNSVNDLAVNDIVEIHGFSDGSGMVSATRIETKDSDEDVEVKGLIANLDELAQTFSIGGMTVDYSSALELPEEALANDLYVEVKSETALSGNSVDGYVMVASKVEIEDDGDMDYEGEEGQEVEITGIISNITEESFYFNGEEFLFSSLDLEDDFNLELLTDGMMIKVEGYFNSENKLVITEFEDEQEAEFETEGYVFEVTETGVVISFGNETMPFVINNSTRMIDERDEGGLVPEHYFGLDDLGVGDYVEIEYYMDEATSDLIATELEREDEPSSFEDAPSSSEETASI